VTDLPPMFLKLQLQTYLTISSSNNTYRATAHVDNTLALLQPNIYIYTQTNN